MSEKLWIVDGHEFRHVVALAPRSGAELGYFDAHFASRRPDGTPIPHADEEVSRQGREVDRLMAAGARFMFVGGTLDGYDAV